MTLQNHLLCLKKPEDRMTSLLDYLNKPGVAEQRFNPDVGRAIWTWPSRKINAYCKWNGRDHPKGMVECRDFQTSGYLAVNEPGRGGWTLLSIACYLEDYVLIEFLLSQGANPAMGNDEDDLRASIVSLFKQKKKPLDECLINRVLAFVAACPKLPNMLWLAPELRMPDEDSYDL